jgi:hypothetical protein
MVKTNKYRIQSKKNNRVTKNSKTRKLKQLKISKIFKQSNTTKKNNERERYQTQTKILKYFPRIQEV